MKRLNYYETEQVTICPYCGDGPKGDDLGCCGESSAHFETAIEYQGEIYSLNEVELYKPILDVIRYEILNKYAWRFRKQRFKRKLRSFLTRLYDGESYWDNKTKTVKQSLIFKLRQFTGFQWTKLDCLILRQLHDFPLYYTPPEEVIKMRQHAKEIENKMKLGLKF